MVKLSFNRARRPTQVFPTLKDNSVKNCLFVKVCYLLISVIFFLLIAKPDLLASEHASPVSWKDPTALNTEVQLLASSSLLLDIAFSGEYTIAVGERGHILNSTDNVNWQQIPGVPTRATLTSIAAVGQHVWVVGHDGVIIYSSDAGRHWQLQHRNPLTPNLGTNEVDPRQGAPLLDVLFLDEARGFAVGAYSQLLATHDGGKTWTNRSLVANAQSNKDKLKTDTPSEEKNQADWNFTKEDLQLAEEMDPHLNAIAQTGDGSLVIAAERGTVFRSRDRGENWERLKLPYEGSMFGVLGMENQRIILFGLRGNVYESMDLGSHWNKVETTTELSIMGGTVTEDGTVVLVGMNGLILTRKKSDISFYPSTFSTGGTLASVLTSKMTGELLLVGESGIKTFSYK